MLPPETTDKIITWFKNSLLAHEQDILDEIRTTEKGIAKASFEVQMKALGAEKYSVKLKARFPRQATVEEDSLDPFQAKFPGM